jgi:hypothetical protein
LFPDFRAKNGVIVEENTRLFGLQAVERPLLSATGDICACVRLIVGAGLFVCANVRVGEGEPKSEAAETSERFASSLNFLPPPLQNSSISTPGVWFDGLLVAKSTN